MAAPRLSFEKEKEQEKKKKRGGTPSPPAPVRDPKKHSLFSNLWAGVESIPRGVLEQEEEFRHATAYDITHPGIHGLIGSALGKKRSRADVVAEKAVKESYETTRRATGTRGLKKAGEIWHDNPVAALGGVAIIAPPVFRVAGITKMSATIRAANDVPTKGGGTRKMTRTEATKAATVESYYPGTLDKLGVKGSPFAPRVSGRRVSRTTTGRASQKAFDWASEKIDTGVGVGARKTGPDTPLSATRREAAGKRRADDLQRGRLVTNAMRHVSTFADYLNDTSLSRVGTALGRRKETLAARDAAVGVALHGSSAIDPVEVVRFGAEDTKAILQSGKRDAHNGDIGDVEPDKRLGQIVWVTHGIDEDGAPVREQATVTADHGDRVTVATEQGEQTIPHARAHLLGPNGEGEIPLNEDEVKMLTRRAALLDTAHEELLAEPRLQEKFRAAVQTMTDLGQMNEQLGEDFFTRGMEPTGSETMALLERLTGRRNQFVPRLGGEGVEAINFQEGLWNDLINTMVKTGNYTDDQIRGVLTIMEHTARVWAMEGEGRNPADYLSSPEGRNIGGIDFAKPEDLEATMNAMFQTAGERHHLVQTQTQILVDAAPTVQDLVSTPKGMGWVRRFVEEEEPDGSTIRVAEVEMTEGAAYIQRFLVDDLRVSQLPWIGRPQVNDYVTTPDGPGLLLRADEGPGPEFETTYTVELFDQEGDHFIPGGEERRFPFRSGEVQRIDDPRDEGRIFHLASQRALGDPKFPKKATAEQYRRAFEKPPAGGPGVKADEFYWMGLSRRPMLEIDLSTAETALRTFEKKAAEDPEFLEVTIREDGDNPANSIVEQRLVLRRNLDDAEARLEAYLDDPDPSMLLDANWGGKSFPVQALQDAVDSRAHFLDLKEVLYSSDAPQSQWRDKWGQSGHYGSGEGSGLIIRTPTDDHPYHELLLQLPQNEPNGPNPHWSGVSEAPLVHIRFHEIVDNEGNRALLIDEIQSDWNLLGRQQGWRNILTPHDKVAVGRLRDKERRLLDLLNRAESELGMGVADLNNWFDRLHREKLEEMNAEIEARNAVVEAARIEGEYLAGNPGYGLEPKLFGYGRDHQIVADRLLEDNQNDQTFVTLMKGRQRFERLIQKRVRLREKADAIELGSARRASVNKGPLVMGDAPRYLAMKRIIRWAADHGQTRIIWGRGHEQGVRYGQFNDLPVRHTSNLDPEDYQGEFSYPTGFTTITLGGHYRSSDVSEEKLYRMQQAHPIEVKFDDLEEYGDQFVLMPNGHPSDVPEGIPGQTSLLGEAEIPAPLARHPRWARLISETDDGAVVQPVDPKWDPAVFEIDYRGDTGDSDYGSWDVRIVNRVGEEIYNNTLDGSINNKSDLLDAVREDWGRTLRDWNGGQAVEITNANDVKMRQLIEILDESDTFGSEFDYMQRNLEYTFDEHSWNEFVESREDDSESAEGDFREIRDHYSYEKRRIKELKDELAELQESQKQDIERGVQAVDYGSLISNQKIAIWRAEQGFENKAHSAGYDEMLPLLGERMLKPYRKEGDYSKIELKHGIYRGRYGSEGEGVISGEGDMHGWVMDLPAKMIRDAKGTVPLFQKGNDIIKGASTWVGGPDGQRFVALTEHADFSTLMHEFIGHATEEMKRRYPELWEAVERDMGLPLEQWKKNHHEKFARYVERYWMEGKAPSPELATVMRMVKEWMKGVYASITQLGRPMPDSTRILLNRHLGQGITARPGARSYVPHVSQFDTLMDSAPGGTRLAAGGSVVGVPQVDRRNFGARRNRGILWQSGELALSARPIIDQYFRRTKFMETEAVRQEMFDEGHPLPKSGRAPEGAWLVRNPEATPERLTARNKSKLSEEDFSRLIGEGDTPEEFVTKMKEIREDHYAAPGEHPEWANDLENTRWVEAGKINQRIQNVFPTAPRGRVAASAGSLNSMARLTGIYLRPLHYLVGNIPQNVIMVALTNPSALVNSAKYGAYSFLPRVVREVGVQPRDLFAHDRHLYNQIKTETGDIQAGAGLPDFYTLANNSFQKGERRLNKISQGSAEKLGELADQPYRVSVWIAHAKGYGFNTPDEWRSLLDSERGSPEARIRDDIAQQTREDMIDFNTLSPGERQNVSRFFYLWAFTRGFAKWPLTFAREYPGRLGAAMLLADPERRDDNEVPLSWLPASGVLKTNKGPGRVRDLGFLDPTGGLRQQVETGIQVAHGNLQGIGGMTTPPLETGIQAITGGPRAPKGGLGGLAEQLARDTVPFWDIGRKATTPGLKISERLERVLDFHDRFGVKAEIGKGKNADKKRLEDAGIRRVLTAAGRVEVLPQVMYQQDAYWHHKYLEQQIRFGAQARRKGSALTDEEKLTILYATAADYFPQTNLPPLSEALKSNPLLQEKLRDDLRDAMFGWRNEAVNAA